MMNGSQNVNATSQNNNNGAGNAQNNVFIQAVHTNTAIPFTFDPKWHLILWARHQHWDDIKTFFSLNPQDIQHYINARAYLLGDFFPASLFDHAFHQNNQDAILYLFNLFAPPSRYSQSALMKITSDMPLPLTDPIISYGG